MKAIVLLGAMLIGIAASVSSGAAETVSPDIFQVMVPVTFQAGASAIDNVSVVTTPSNKRLVIQAVSYFRGNGSPGSSTTLFLGTTIFNNLSYWAIPPVYTSSGGAAYPSTTLSATFYAGAGTNVFINAYRNGELTYSETMYVTVSGYYVAKP